VTTPKISVIIPTHNRAGLLTLTLASVLWQQHVDLEAIVVDDGSTEGEVGTVPGIDDPRVRVIRTDSAEGVSLARNRGLGEARGEWIAFLDDDDLWAPTKLAAQLAAAVERGRTWAYTGVIYIGKRNEIIGGTRPPSPRELIAQLPRWNLVPGGCSGVIVTRDALATAGVFDPALVSLADWDMWIRLARTGPPARAPDPLVAYRIHGRQASLNVDLILREADLMDGRYGHCIDRASLHHYLAHRCLVAGRRLDTIKHWGLAAVYGRPGPVVADAAGMLRTRVERYVPLPQRTDPHAAWRAKGAIWLRSLQDKVGSPRRVQPQA
jgi:glycosyltransferase involved in cell wall biosynthesis